MPPQERSILKLFLLKNISNITNIFVISFILYIIYYFHSFYPKNIVSIYILLIFIGYGSHKLKYWISWPLYMLHVFLLPEFVILLRTFKIPPPMGPIIFIFSSFVIAVIGIIYFFNIKTNVFKNAFNEQLPDYMIILFLLLGVTLPNPTNMSEIIRDIIIIVFVFTFFIVSLTYLNRKFRKIMLCKKFNTFNLERLLADYLTAFEHSFPGDENDKDFIMYYFERAINSFIFGDFEDSFMNSFKIVFDPEFKDIYKIRDYDNRRPRYREIRAAIAHPIKEELYEDVAGLKKFRKYLFNDTLELLGITKNEFMDHFTCENQ